jgi:hypothetical protein
MECTQEKGNADGTPHCECCSYTGMRRRVPLKRHFVNIETTKKAYRKAKEEVQGWIS